MAASNMSFVRTNKVINARNRRAILTGKRPESGCQTMFRAWNYVVLLCLLPTINSENLKFSLLKMYSENIHDRISNFSSYVFQTMTNASFQDDDKLPQFIITFLY